MCYLALTDWFVNGQQLTHAQVRLFLLGHMNLSISDNPPPTV